MPASPAARRRPAPVPEGLAALLELRIGEPAAGGGCVSHAPDGRVVFVRHALPGELVSARVTEEATSYLRADAVDVLEASPDRVSPPCPYAGPGRCGGCDWQHVDLAAQRELKARLVAEQLRRLAGVARSVAVEEVAVPGGGLQAPSRPEDPRALGPWAAAADADADARPGSRADDPGLGAAHADADPDPDSDGGERGAGPGLGWRTRVRFAVDGSGRVGFRRHRSHRVEVVDRCLIASPGVEAVGVATHRWPGASSVEVLTTADGGRPVVAVETARRRPGNWPSLEAGRVVDGRTEQEPHRLATEVLGRRYEVSTGVFWQVHPGAAPTLARLVLELLAPRPGERAADLFAGAGLFAALLGQAVGPEGAVLAVERNRRACADADRNTVDLPQVTVHRAEVTVEMVAGLADLLGGPPDVVVLDPARQGAGRDVMAALAALDPAPRAVVSVACDPASFARDVRTVLDRGWEMPVLRAFDLFPMTEHVELVALLTPPTPAR